MADSTTVDVPRVLNPRDLVIEANVRSETKLTKEFVSSIKQHGILNPVIVEHVDDAWHVLDGQRRVLAAIQLELTEIPVHVVDRTTESGHLIAQLVVNDHREALTEAEHAATYKQLALIGVSADQIARKTNTPRKRVETAIAVASSDQASAVLSSGNVTLDQAAAIVEFKDPEVVEQLTKVALETPHNFDHIVKLQQRKAETEAEREELIAQLTAEGYTITDEIKQDYHFGKDIARIDYLYTDAAAKTRLASWANERIPNRDGLKAVITSHYEWSISRDKVDVAFYIDGWQEQGLHLTKYNREQLDASKPAGGGLTEEQKAERKLTRDNNKLWGPATEVRLAFVRNLLQQKEPPVGWELFVARFIAGYEFSRESTYAAGLLGIKVNMHEAPRWLKENPTKAIPFMIAMAIAAVENSFEFAKSGWRREQAPAYLAQLSKWGYNLSELEESVAKKAAK